MTVNELIAKWGTDGMSLILRKQAGKYTATSPTGRTFLEMANDLEQAFRAHVPTIPHDFWEPKS